jgi:hypothetical protein
MSCQLASHSAIRRQDTRKCDFVAQMSVRELREVIRVELLFLRNIFAGLSYSVMISRARVSESSRSLLCLDEDYRGNKPFMSPGLGIIPLGVGRMMALKRLMAWSLIPLGPMITLRSSPPHYIVARRQ